jgi:hypothetical protein
MTSIRNVLAASVALLLGGLLTLPLLSMAMFAPGQIHWVFAVMAVSSFGLTALSPRAWWLIALLLGLPSAWLAIVDGEVVAETIAAAFVPAFVCYWLYKKEWLYR